MAEQIYRRHLPEEIITEILTRLSVKSLLRLKSVCKSWRCLISSKHFVKTQLENSKKNKSFAHHKIIAPSFSPPKYQGTLFECSLSSLLIEPVTHAFPLDFLPTKNNSTDIVTKIVGSCNGLICLVVDTYRFFLLNPSTRECKEMPDFCDGVKHPSTRNLITAEGFGFDEISGDYKIFAVFSNVHTRTSVAKVYSLMADSWASNVLFKHGLMFGSGTFVSGKLHWLSYLQSSSKWEIVCFDLKSETFETLELNHRMNNYPRPSLGVLKGCLCVFFNRANVESHIWIWKEYGVEDSWSNLNMLAIYSSCKYSSNHSLARPCCPPITPLFALPNDEVVFTCRHHFHNYSLKSDRVMQLNAVDADPLRPWEAIVHAESLVSLVTDDDVSEQEV